MDAPNAWSALMALRDALALVAGVTTCKVGLEANITPADYPMVRIVPSRMERGAVMGRRGVEVLIYFGQPVHEFEQGLEGQYEQLLTMEAAIIDAIDALPQSRYFETIADEDRIEGYKLMAVRAQVQG